MTLIEQLWKSMREHSRDAAIPKGGYHLTRLDSAHRYDIYAGLDSRGAAALAIGTTTMPPALNADTGALTYFRLDRPGGRWIMGLRLDGEVLEEVFGKLCQDLAEMAAAMHSEAAVVQLFRDRLELWRRLFSATGNGLLKKFQIKGLIAELMALEQYINNAPADGLKPVTAWAGPDRSHQDFMFDDGAVEVKAVAPDATQVTISSVAQLDASLPLVLRVYRLRECAPAESAALTLPILVARIEALLDGVPNAVPVFRQKLLESGYVEHDFYRTVAFSPVEMSDYAVLEGFPRLTMSSLPDGITDATYAIVLSALARFRHEEAANAA